MIATPHRPIRALHVLHSLSAGGAERIVCDLARCRSHQLRMDVVCLDGPGHLADEARDLGVEVLCTGRRHGLDLRQVRRLAAWIDRRRPDVIHAHQYTPYFYSALAATVVGFGPIVFTEHGRHWPDVVSSQRKMINQLLRLRRDRVTAVCRFVADALRYNERIAGRDIQVIPNGVACERFRRPRPRRRLAELIGAGPGEPILIQVARLHRVKDHETAIRALAGIRRFHPDAHLVCVGDGPETGRVRSLSQALGVQRAVHLLGLRTDVPDLLASADVSVLSSLSEGASLSILEAMSAALPVVATDVGGNREIVHHGRTGLLSPRCDPASMAGNLRTLLGNAELRCRMGEAGRRRVQALYTQTRMQDAFIELYRRLMEEKE